MDTLRDQVENQGGFQLVIAPIFPKLYPNVWMAAESLYKQFSSKGLSVLLDDRNRRPRNMFEVIEFLGIRHRIVISGRSLSANVVEYKDLKTEAFHKIEIEQTVSFVCERIWSPPFMQVNNFANDQSR